MFAAITPDAHLATVYASSAMPEGNSNIESYSGTCTAAELTALCAESAAHDASWYDLEPGE